MTEVVQVWFHQSQELPEFVFVGNVFQGENTMRNFSKKSEMHKSSGRSSAASDKKELNDEEVEKKIDELRKKARQEMMDFEALDGVSLAHYLRIKQATTRLLSVNEDEGVEEQGGTVGEVEKVKEEEMQKMARNILRKWQSFTKGEAEPREVRPKRRKSVRFKDEVSMDNKENNGLLETESSEEKIKLSLEDGKDVQIVFPAIIRPRPSRRRHRRPKEHLGGSLLPPISQKEEKLMARPENGDILPQDRLPPLNLKPVSLTTRTPPPSEDDEAQERPSGIHTPEAVFYDSFDQPHIPQGNKESVPPQGVFPHSTPNSPVLGRQPTPFPGGVDGTVENENCVSREPTLLWRLKEKITDKPSSNSSHEKGRNVTTKRSKRGVMGNAFMKRIQHYEVSEEPEETNEQNAES